MVLIKSSFSGYCDSEKLFGVNSIVVFRPIIVIFSKIYNVLCTYVWSNQIFVIVIIVNVFPVMAGFDIISNRNVMIWYSSCCVHILLVCLNRIGLEVCLVWWDLCDIVLSGRCLVFSAILNVLRIWFISIFITVNFTSIKITYDYCGD